MCHMENERLKSANAAIGVVRNLNVINKNFGRTNGRMSHIGKPIINRGGTINVRSTCWSIWALKRYSLLRMCSGDSRDSINTIVPAVNEAISRGLTLDASWNFSLTGPMPRR